MIDVGFWELAAYCAASFIIGGFMGMAVMATMAAGKDDTPRERQVGE